MEAIATVSAVSAFLQVASFSAGVLRCTRELVSEGRLMLRETTEVDELAKQHLVLSASASQASSSSPAGKEALKLAKRCQSQSQELLEIVRAMALAPNQRGMKGLFEKGKIAQRAVRKRAEIESRRQKLQELNQQLATALLLLLETSTKDTAAAISATQTGLRKLIGDHSEDLRDAFANLEQAWKGEQRSASNNMVHLISEIAHCSEKVDRFLEQSTLTRLIDILGFSHEHEREHAIDWSHSDTYAWPFQQDCVLYRWLRNDEGIFWLSGKPGSGKSTLMKRLSTRPETMTLLKAWSNGHSLTVTSFYFWYFGSPLQKSMEGLIRSILKQILTITRSPCLAQRLFPRVWRNLTLPQLVRSESSFDVSEVMIALQKLVTEGDYLSINESTGSKIKFCFFIDGLDEYHGDQTDLVQLLQLLAQSPNIKICAASRPENIFQKAFGSLRSSLKLQDYTREDIKRFVEGKLGEVIAENHTTTSNAVFTDLVRVEGVSHDWTHQRENIIQQIVEKAEGVFLWVVLAVRSVLEGINEGDTPSVLRQRIDDLPSDLEEFFESILRRVGNVYRIQTAQALQMACIYASYTHRRNLGFPGDKRRTKEDDDTKQGNMLSRSFIKDGGSFASFLEYWFMSHSSVGIEDKTFFLNMKTKACSPQEWAAMIVATGEFLNASSKGLLHMITRGVPLTDDLGIHRSHAASDHLAFRPVAVEFIHRSVYDFLSSDAMQIRLEQDLPALFRDDNLINYMRLGQLKCRLGEEGFANDPADCFSCLPIRLCDSILSNPWDTLDCGLVGGIADAISGHPLVIQWMDLALLNRLSHTSILIAFVAFQHHKVIAERLCTMTSKGPLPRRPFSNSPLDILLEAAIGLCPRKEFESSKVDLAFVEQLLTAGANPQARSPDYDVLSRETIYGRLSNRLSQCRQQYGMLDTVMSATANGASHTKDSDIIALFDKFEPLRFNSKNIHWDARPVLPPSPRVGTILENVTSTWLDSVD